MINRRSRFAVSTILALIACGSVARADSHNVLTRLKGSVTIQRAGATAFKSLSGSVGVREGSIARTGSKSAAMLALGDRSEIDLGEKTQLRVGTFDRDADVAGHTISVDSGALTFTIRHPAGARANYRFVTPTARIAVRGAVGLLIVTPARTTLICLSCSADDIVVTHDGTDESVGQGHVLQLVGIPGSQSVIRLPLDGFIDPALEQFLGETYKNALAKAAPAIKAAMKPRATPDPCASKASTNHVSSDTPSEQFDSVTSKPGCT